MRWRRCSRWRRTSRSSRTSAAATRWSRRPWRRRPDVALLDIEMPGLDGLAAAAQLRTAVPGCRVAILTTFGRPGYLRRAMEAGATGFLLKDAPATELADAIRRVARGQRVVDPALALAALWRAPTRCRSASARPWPSRRPAAPSPTSRRASACPREPSGTTSRRRSRRPAPGTAPRPRGSRRTRAGSHPRPRADPADVPRPGSGPLIRRSWSPRTNRGGPEPAPARYDAVPTASHRGSGR